MTRTCSDCPTEISKHSKGRCKSCSARHLNSDPELTARRRAGVAAYAARPEVKRAMARRLALHMQNLSPEERERRREHGRHIAATVLQTPAVRARSNSPEAKAKAGRARTNTVLADIPPPYRDRYRYLTTTQRMRAAEAKSLILDEVAADQRRAAASAAAPTPFERQMAAVAAGAKVIAKPILRRPDHEFTLGGVATGML